MGLTPVVPLRGRRAPADDQIGRQGAQGETRQARLTKPLNFAKSVMVVPVKRCYDLGEICVAQLVRVDRGTEDS
jgi:hypothetical protein